MKEKFKDYLKMVAFVCLAALTGMIFQYKIDQLRMTQTNQSTTRVYASECDLVNCSSTIRYGETVYVRLGQDKKVSDYLIHNKPYLDVAEVSEDIFTITLTEDIQKGKINILDKETEKIVKSINIIPD